MKHLEHHNILSDQQHGFRKTRPCETHLLATINDLAKSIDESRQIDVNTALSHVGPTSVTKQHKSLLLRRPQASHQLNAALRRGAHHCSLGLERVGG